MSDPRTDPDAGHGDPVVDPVTGYDTTGHDWNGIRELNTPFPRFVLWILAAAFAYSVVAWVLLPAWPVGGSYTKGLLGLDQSAVAMARFEKIDARRTDWLARFTDPDFAALGADGALMAKAMPAAERLFLDNCAACHGAKATGGPGFPALADGSWLWDGSPEGIAETITVGINSAHAEARFGQMPAFGALGMLPREKLEAVADYVAALPSGAADATAPGAAVFEENCAACHGPGGAGGLGLGAPTLSDKAAIYGQDRDTVWRTLWHGRQGVMPSWEGRLSPAERNLLALYVARLNAGTGGQ